MTGRRVVFIGASAGGVSALQRVLERLPKSFTLPIVVVQHLPRDAQIDLELVFGRFSTGRVFEARDKMPIEPGHVYFAPPGYHLLVEKDSTFSLCQDDPVHFARPSIDVLFESAANAFGHDACGVLLTGANADGAEGMKAIQDCGGMTIVQTPETAESALMPQSALRIMKPDVVLDLDTIASRLIELAQDVKL